MIPTDPRPLTLRELLWMADGARRERWARTSSMMALTANCNRDPRRGRPLKPADFDPYAEDEPPVIVTRETAQALRRAIEK